MEFEKHALILAVIEKLRQHGSWTGKTHVQKALSLLADTSDVDVPFAFVLYRHGPYSFDVESELEQMRSYSAIDVLPNPAGYGVTIRPGRMAPFVKNEASLASEDETAIDRVCAFVDGKTVTELERVATAAWIRGRKEVADPRKVAEQLHELKPHISVAEASVADRELCRFLDQSQGN